MRSYKKESDMKLSANWITAPRDAGVAAFTYRKDFALAKPIKKATLRASAMGLYAPHLNGARIGKAVLAPGWTSYKTRVLYQTYDITNLLAESNRLEIGVGQGWAVGYLSYRGSNHYFADHTSLIAQINLIYADGTKETICTDESWEVYTSPVLSSEIYHGETVDMTAPIELVGNARVDNVKVKVEAQMGEFIAEHERLAPVEVIRTPKGELVVDFGQNMTGYVEVKIKAPRGSRIVMHHAEVLDKDGNFYNDNYREARNENIYVCSGGEDTFKPSYTFQGFRYIKLLEYPFDEVDVDGLRAIAVHSDMKRTGYFSCGNEKINQLYHNIIWGQKSNYLDVPTDCPQRDERLGWTGDTQVFCRTGSINFDTEKFFRKWLGDVAIEQFPDGAVEGIVPQCIPIVNNRKYATRVSAAWGDVATVVPWELYRAYGNKKDLKAYFPMMKKWVEYMHHAGPAEYLWLGGRHYGDWLAMDAGGEEVMGATSNDLIASVFFAYSTELLIKAGEALGKDMSKYRALLINIKKTFREYFMENGMPKDILPLTEDSEGASLADIYRRGTTQTSLVLILHFNMCEEHERPALIAKLVELIHDFGGRMSTGFVGTPYILHTLSENGHTDLAYDLLFQEQNPSWLFSVCHGATTMWEHWNSQREDGSFWSTTMNSFNHYAYGAVYDWIFGVSCGVTASEDGVAYKKIDIAPHPDRRLGFVNASLETRSGLLRSNWYYKGDTVYYEFEIPEGSIANLTLPSGFTATLEGGIHHFAE